MKHCEPGLDDLSRHETSLKDGPPADWLEASPTRLHRMRCVDRVACYVDEHLAHPLTTDELSAVAGMSKFHFHRTVLSLTGETPAQLVSGSRLRTAMVRLARNDSSRLRIIDVAFEVGFHDASAFSRSFRSYFGVTPSQVQRGARRPSLWEPQGRVSRPSPRRDVGVSTSPSSFAYFTELPTFYCYGHEAEGGRERTFAKQAPQAFASTFEYVERHGIGESLGQMAVPGDDASVDPGVPRLLCAFRSPVQLALEHIMERRIPGGRYLVSRHVGPYEGRWQTWSRLSVLRRTLLGKRGAAGARGRTPFEVERRLTSGGLPSADIYFPL